MLAIPLALFFQSTLSLVVGAIVAVLGKWFSPLAPPRLARHPAGSLLERGVKALIFLAAVGVLAGLFALAVKDAGGKAGRAAREWSQRLAPKNSP